MNNILNKYDEITNDKLIIALFMFVFIIPNGMLEMTYSILPMFKIRILFGLLIALKLCIKLKDKKKFPPMLLVGIIYCFARFIRTYIATGILKTSLFDYSALITLPLIMLVESNIDNNAKNFIHGVLIYVETIIVLGGGLCSNPKIWSLIYRRFYIRV